MIDVVNPGNLNSKDEISRRNKNFSFMGKLEGAGRDSSLIILEEDLANMMEDIN